MGRLHNSVCVIPPLCMRALLHALAFCQARVAASEQGPGHLFPSAFPHEDSDASLQVACSPNNAILNVEPTDELRRFFIFVRDGSRVVCRACCREVIFNHLQEITLNTLLVKGARCTQRPLVSHPDADVEVDELLDVLQEVSKMGGKRATPFSRPTVGRLTCIGCSTNAAP